MMLGVLNHTIHCAGWSLLYLLGYAFTEFATSVLLLFAKLVVVTATTIINEIIIFFIPYCI